MTASIVGSPVDSTSTTGTSLTVNLPAAPTNGNLLLMILGFWNVAPGTPAGWNQRALTEDWGSMRIGLYARIVDGSEGSSVNVSGYFADDSRTATVLEIAGHGGYDVAVSEAGDSFPITVPSVTTTVDDCLVIGTGFSQITSGGTAAWGAWASGTSVTTFTTGVASGYFSMQAVAQDTKPTAGATGTVVASTTGTGWANSWAAATIAIKPSAGAPTPVAYLYDGSAWNAAGTIHIWNQSTWEETPIFPA